MCTESRFAFFPQPGDVKKRLLPLYILDEETKAIEKENAAEESEEEPGDAKMYWMPVCNAQRLSFP
jgi:hypothetical protein